MLLCFTQFQPLKAKLILSKSFEYQSFWLKLTDLLYRMVKSSGHYCISQILDFLRYYVVKHPCLLLWEDVSVVFLNTLWQSAFLEWLSINKFQCIIAQPWEPYLESIGNFLILPLCVVIPCAFQNISKTVPWH